ncbi:MAG: CBS domain-containing protein [Chloroflexi bacterium]|nr:CBS domain-containing protein [Chloroflexota bacterium]
MEPGRDGHISFPELLRGARAVIPRRLELDLRELSELRNALVHGTNGRVMAEPTRDAVGEIEHIRDLLLSPPLVIDLVQRGRVVTVSPRHSLASAVARMRSDGFAQLPVYGPAGYVGLLTTHTIVRWLADTGMDAARSRPTIGDVLAHAEATDECKVLPASTTAMGALDAFELSRQVGRELVAILISEHGRTDVQPLAIVTVHDLHALVAAVYPRPAPVPDPG